MKSRGAKRQIERLMLAFAFKRCGACDEPWTCARICLAYVDRLTWVRAPVAGGLGNRTRGLPSTTYFTIRCGSARAAGEASPAGVAVQEHQREALPSIL